MRLLSKNLIKNLHFVVLVLSFLIFGIYTPDTVAQQANPVTNPTDLSGDYRQLPVDSRVEIRTYLFEDANEKLQYTIFISSKVSPEIKAPLIIVLHGLGGTHTSLMRGNAFDRALGSWQRDTNRFAKHLWFL